MLYDDVPYESLLLGDVPYEGVLYDDVSYDSVLKSSQQSGARPSHDFQSTYPAINICSYLQVTSARQLTLIL